MIRRLPTPAFMKLMSFAVLLLVSQPAFADLVEVQTNTPLRNVYLLEDMDADDVRMEVFFIAGEADWDGPQGLSHYLEHLMYWHANKAVSGDELHGRRGNAWVNGYVTNYHSQAQRSLAGQVFDFGRALLDPPDLDQDFMLEERDVIVREYDLRHQDNPDIRVYDSFKRQLLGDNPAGRSVIGDPDSILSLNVEDAKRFHSDFYHPANMVLLIAGAISADEVKREIEKRFAGLESGEDALQNWRWTEITGEINEEITFSDPYVAFNALQYQALGEWTLAKQKIDDQYAIDLVAMFLNSAVAGSPAKALRTQEFVFSAYDFWIDTVLDGRSILIFQGRLDKDVEHQTAVTALRQTLAGIAQQGIPEASLERLKKRMIKQAVRKGEEKNFVLGRAARLLSSGINPNTKADDLQRLEAVTKEQVDGFLASFASPKRQAMISIIPEKK